jgi:hypothetical protein
MNEGLQIPLELVKARKWTLPTASRRSSTLPHLETHSRLIQSCKIINLCWSKWKACDHCYGSKENPRGGRSRTTELTWVPPLPGRAQSPSSGSSLGIWPQDPNEVWAALPWSSLPKMPLSPHRPQGFRNSKGLVLIWRITYCENSRTVLSTSGIWGLRNFLHGDPT